MFLLLLSGCFPSNEISTPWLPNRRIEVRVVEDCAGGLHTLQSLTESSG